MLEGVKDVLNIGSTSYKESDPLKSMHKSVYGVFQDKAKKLKELMDAEGVIPIEDTTEVLLELLEEVGNEKQEDTELEDWGVKDTTLAEVKELTTRMEDLENLVPEKPPRSSNETPMKFLSSSATLDEVISVVNELIKRS